MKYECVCFFWQMFVFVVLNASSKKHTVSSMWEAGLLVCKQSHSYYSSLCHSNSISWRPPIKRHCSTKYYSLLMFNVSSSALNFEHILLGKTRLDMQTINHPSVYF